MKMFLFVILALASAGPLAKLKEAADVTSLKQRVVGDSLLERCRNGNPILIETTDLPGNNRQIGDPCSSDSQCRDPLQCSCQAHGGKECSVSVCLIQGVEVPSDGKYHNVHCTMNCKCTSEGAAECLDMCPIALIDCPVGQHSIQVRPRPGQCCTTLKCIWSTQQDCSAPNACGPARVGVYPCPDGTLGGVTQHCIPDGDFGCTWGIHTCDDKCTIPNACPPLAQGSSGNFPCFDGSIGGYTGRCVSDGKDGCTWEIHNCLDPMDAKCCDPTQQPGLNGLRQCLGGTVCCAVTGTWVCNNGDGSYPCAGLEYGPWGHTCTSAP